MNKKGTVKAFDGSTYTATVQIRGNVAIWLRNVPVARNIASGELVAGRSCVGRRSALTLAVFSHSRRDRPAPVRLQADRRE